MDKNKKEQFLKQMEKAIYDHYGLDAIKVPEDDWDKEREEEFLKQWKNKVKKDIVLEKFHEVVNVGGISMPQKLINRKNGIKNCSICKNKCKTIDDDVMYIKYSCCYKCYINHLEGQEKNNVKF